MGFVAKRQTERGWTRDFGSRTIVQIGISSSKITKIGGTRETETEKVWKLEEIGDALWQSAERDNGCRYIATRGA
jgi:hypothetical protein